MHRDSLRGVYVFQKAEEKRGKVWLPGDEDGHRREARRRYLDSRHSPGCRRSHPPRKGARIKGGGQVLERGGKHKLRKEVKVNGEAIDQTGAVGGVV